MEVHQWRLAAVRPLSTLRIAENDTTPLFHWLWPLNFSTVQMLSAANVMNWGWQCWLCPGRHSLSAAHGNPTLPPPPPHQQSQTNDFDLSSAVQGRSYRYNPPNDVKDLSAKLMNDKNSPPLSTALSPPPNLKNTSTEGQEDWEPGHFIDFFPPHPHPHLFK